MDAFTQRVELEDDEMNTLAQPLHPASGGTVADNNDDSGGPTSVDDDQVVPGHEDRLETLTRRRRPFYEGS